jgi:hypothetical protein
MFPNLVRGRRLAMLIYRLLSLVAVLLAAGPWNFGFGDTGCLPQTASRNRKIIAASGESGVSIR